MVRGHLAECTIRSICTIEMMTTTTQQAATKIPLTGAVAAATMAVEATTALVVATAEAGEEAIAAVVGEAAVTDP